MAPQSPDYRTLLKDALVSIEKMQAKLTAEKNKQSEPLAIVGMACRYPGANTPEEFWALLRDGVDVMTEVPADRWNIDDYYDPIPGIRGKMYVRQGGFLSDIDQFDPEFFNISPREAISLDPQHRLLLEVSWEALERAGIAPTKIQNSRTGVFVAISSHDYDQMVEQAGHQDAYTATGNGFCFASGRLSYLLGLQGPNMVVDTACSSSLVGIHLAAQSLRSGECDQALIGAVNLILRPEQVLQMAQMQALAPDGRCKTFDAAANGFNSGEGCGIIVLKRLSDALASSDTILAVVRGSAVNHNGSSGGLTVPSKMAQERLIRDALENSRVKPRDVMYVEAHGTGTALGDPIEAHALADVFHEPQRPYPLWVGSVKTNFGHLEPAAGMAGLMKTILAFQNNEIPPHLHFRNPNPQIDWENSPLQIPTEPTAWPERSQGQKRIAGVSSFGMGGANAHLIVEEATAIATKTEPADIPDRPLHILNLSARNPAALTELVQRFITFLETLLHTQSSVSLANICHTMNTGRSHFDHSVNFVAQSNSNLYTQLTEWYAQNSHHELPSSLATDLANTPSQNLLKTSSTNPRIAFLLTGQGSQYTNMGRELYDTQPTFRRVMDQCDEILKTSLGESILTILYPGNSASKTPDNTAEQADHSEYSLRLNQTIYAQPALFALEYALAQLWMSWGVQPSVVLGHSVGEYVAACLAGVFSLEDGLKLIAARGRLMQALPPGDMLSVRSSEEQVAAIIAPYQSEVSIAVINGPESVVISGTREAIDQLTEQFATQDIKTHRLAVSHAFHSPMMVPMLNAFREVANSIRYAPPHLSLISNVTGQLATRDVATPEYWVHHVCATVRFADGIAALQTQNLDVFLEVGSKSTLLGMAQQICSGSEATTPPLMLPSLSNKDGDWVQMLSTCGQLFASGVAMDWVAFDRDYPRQKVVLPTYPFQRKRYWVDSALTQHQRSTPATLAPLPQFLDRTIQLPLKNKLVFETEFNLQRMPYLVDHKIFGEVIVPGACFVSMMFKTARELFSDSAHGLRDIIFQQPLVLGSEESHTVQTILTFEDRLSLYELNASEPEQSAAIQFQIVSFPSTGRLQEAAKVHVTGTLEVIPSQSGVALSIDELRHHCPQQISHLERYSRMAQTGIILGPSFGWISELWSGEETYLAHLSLPRCVGDIQDNPLHLALLDSCFLVVGDIDPDSLVTRLPFSIDSVQLYSLATGDEWWCYTQKVDEGVFDIQLLDKAGKTIAKIVGFADKEAPAEKFFKLDNSQQSPSSLLQWHSHLLDADPLWNKMVRLPSEQTVLFETDYSLQKFPRMTDLEIFGQAIVPIAYSASLMLNAAQALFPKATYELRDVFFHKPLAIDEGKNYTLQAMLDVEPLDDQQNSDNSPEQLLENCPEIDFKLLSFQSDDQDYHDAKVYGTGRLGIRQAEQPKFLDLNELQKRCDRPAEFDQWYSLVSKKGYYLGPYYYEWFDGFWRGDEETLSRLRLPEGVESVNGHQIYFTLLHACIMTTNLLYTHEDSIVRTAYGLESVRLHGPATGDEWWCYAQRVSTTQHNFQLMNSRGLVLAEVMGYIEREVLHQDTYFKETDRDTWLYQINWQPQPKVSDALTQTVTVPSGRCLILSNGSENANALVAQLTTRGIQATVKLTDSQTDSSSDRDAIDLHIPADVETLLGSWPELQQVVYLCQGDRNGQNSQATDPQPMEQAQDICAALLSLAQSLLNTYTKPPALLVVTQDAQAVIEPDRVTGFVQSSLWGLSRVMMLEHPELRCVCLDVEAGGSQEGVAETIAAQFSGGDRAIEQDEPPMSQQPETLLAWRGGQAHGARLSRYKQKPQQTVTVHSDGAYLITGGRGGVGLQVAKWLIEQGAKHLVLLGRSQPSPEVCRVLDEFEAMGATIVSAQADIGDKTALTSILQDLAVPLRGVIHAAGVLDDGILLQQTPAKFENVLGPKVQGAWNLHLLTLEQPLDFFVVFSSATSLFGARGQANYAAANAFLDGLAAYRHGLGLPCLSINWGAWSEVGMAAQQGLLDQLPSKGEGAIPLEDGLELFGELLQEPVPQIGVVPVEWSRFFDRQNDRSPFYEKFFKPSSKQGSSPRSKADDIQAQLKQAPVQDRLKFLEAHVRALLAQLLGVAVADLPSDEGVGFVTLGLDSLNSIELRNSLQHSLGCSLPVTFAFDYPTIEAAVEYLAAIVLPPMDSAASPQPEEPADPGQNGETPPQEEESLSTLLDKLATHLD